MSQMDNVVLSWFNDTITVSRRTLHAKHDSLSRVRNREVRALHLDAQFHLFSQGDLFVVEYCCQMKGMADSLRDLGEPVADRTSVRNLLRGLSPCYGHLKALIKRTVPLSLTPLFFL
jgi:hypothetical protein